MKVVGGAYVEICREPYRSTQYFGSGGRGAAVLGSLNPNNVNFYSYADDETEDYLKSHASIFDFSIKFQERIQKISFDYHHVLSKPQIYPFPLSIERKEPIKISGSTVLRFGMLECSISTDADATIYDPQSENAPIAFEETDSKTGRLAIVLNQNELSSLGNTGNFGSDIDCIINKSKADVLIVKKGPLGALICTKEHISPVPAFKTSRVWKIGSGDVFSAAFSYFWGEKKFTPYEAGELASLATAFYCNNSGNPKIPDQSGLKGLSFPPLPTDIDLTEKKIYLAGPFFDISQRWLILQAKKGLEGFGANVFSPVHDVGYANKNNRSKVYRKDIDGLNECKCVFAICNGSDVGTIYEIGYAVCAGIPVVVLAENISEKDMLMLEGSPSVTVCDDFCTALYETIWQCLEI